MYAPLSRIYFWTPIFFLYFSQRFPIEQVLQLEAIYYAAVVIFEVPSGYFSDRVGRRVTLVCSALAMAVGYTLFLTGDTSFLLFALGQLGKAVGYAFLSGTETAFHYDTLAALGRADEYAAREARLARNGYLAAAAGMIVSGALSTYDLRIAYLLSLLGALAMLVLVLSLREPPREATGWANDGPGAQLAACVRLLRVPLLLWLFAYFILKITLEHIPYEFSQPYLAAVLDEPVTQVRSTPAASGALYAVVAVVGSLAAAYSIRIRARLGTAATLLAAALVQTALIGAMAALISPLIVPLLALRSGLAAIANPIIHAEVTPRVPQAQRATYLSLHSLAGRLGYSGVLACLSALAAGRSVDDPQTVTSLLGWAFVLACVGVVALLVTSRVLARGGPSANPS